MLDQYRQDLNNDSDNLGESRFQMSRRKVVFTLAGSALALLFFLFIIGAFRAEDEVSGEKGETQAVATELTDLQSRVEKLEQLIGAKAIAANTASPQENNNTMNDSTLKQLIASGDDSASSQDAPPYSPAEQNQPASMEYNEAPAQSAAPAPQAAPQSRTYVVQKGDTLSKISQKCYGTTKKWKQIYDANRDRISNINALKVGTKLTIPEDSSK